MPTEKRQRQKAGRDAKRAAAQRAKKRKRLIRNTIIVVIGLAIIIGISVAVTSGGGSPKASSTTSTTSTTAPSASASAQETADKAAVAAGCPSSPTAKLTKPSWKTAPPMTINTSMTYTAAIKTDVGTFDVKLNAAGTPVTVNSFVFLANQKFYNCVTFHRVIPQFMDQTGDPTGTGTGGPGYTYADELPAKASPQYPLGSVAMANSGPNTNGSQFFIVAGPQGESLPASYTLFGQVTSGMSVVDAINADGNSNTASNGVPPKVIHRILSVTITTS
ncbi:MAG TPA: peptidylprolyl isomerase [Acidimicrobiales bacterium]|nr:peptidylprolyl isomerase [Acidimicrobiales bacterium]